MIEPSIEELTKEIQKNCEISINRYELVIATAKAARIITDIQIEKREEMEMEKSMAKESSSSEKSAAAKEMKDIPDVKMVKSAIYKIFNGEFYIATEAY